MGLYSRKGAGCNAFLHFRLVWCERAFAVFDKRARLFVYDCCIGNGNAKSLISMAVLCWTFVNGDFDR